MGDTLTCYLLPPPSAQRLGALAPLVPPKHAARCTLASVRLPAKRCRSRPPTSVCTPIVPPLGPPSPTTRKLFRTLRLGLSTCTAQQQVGVEAEEKRARNGEAGFENEVAL